MPDGRNKLRAGRRPAVAAEAGSPVAGGNCEDAGDSVHSKYHILIPEKEIAFGVGGNVAG